MDELRKIETLVRDCIQEMEHFGEGDVSEAVMAEISRLEMIEDYIAKIESTV